MKCLIKEARMHAFPPKEMTFFSVDGIIGRYENPTSDLLRFFMCPAGGHELGTLFLHSLFACLHIDCGKLSFEGVQVRTRLKTDDRKFPDLLILGLEWVLVIENKIRAQNENPLPSYEQYARDHFSNRQRHFAILSPDGRTAPNHPEWKAVSYEGYCQALKSELAKLCFARPISKWQIFAREFILHLENTLYNPAMTMTQEQKDFVELNLREIGDLKKLSECYTEDILHQLSERLKSALPATQLGKFYDQHGRHEVYGSKGILRFQLWFQTPAQEINNFDRQYIISVWVSPLTQAQRERGAGLLARKGHEIGEAPEHGDWVGTKHFVDCREAVDALYELTKEVVELWGNEPPISTADITNNVNPA